MRFTAWLEPAMILRCKTCDALIGVRPPYNDWSADRASLCPQCAKPLLDEALAKPPKHGEKDMSGPTAHKGRRGRKKK